MRFARKTIPFEITLLLVWIIVILLVDPLGEFPINDDWAYSRNVWFLSEEGRLVFSDWPGMTLISQTLTGALFAKLFGFSLSMLRLMTLAFGISFLLLLYRFLRNLEIQKSTAAFTSILIMFSPLFFSLSFTFMTEIYFLFFLLIALMFYRQYLVSKKVIFLLASSVVALIAALTRQTGVLIPIAIGVVEILRSEWKPKRILLSLIPLVIVVSGLRIYLHWLEATGKLPLNYGRMGDLLENLLQNNLDYFMRRAGVISMYIGLFLLPVSLRMIPSISWPTSRFSRTAFTVTLIFLTSLIVMGFKEFPVPNVFYNLGLGPKLLKDSYWGRNISPVLPPVFWIALKCMAVSGVYILISLLFSRSIDLSGFYKRIRKEHITILRFTLFLMWAGYLLYLLISRFFFDRYTLSFTILSAVLLTASVKTQNRKWNLISAGSMGLFVVFSITAVHDFMEWNRARWRGLEYLLEEQNIDERRIDGGFEFNAWHATGPFNPANKDEKSWWFVTEDEYVLSCGPLEGFRLHNAFPYTRWLYPGKDSVLILWHAIEGKLPYDIFPVQCNCETLAENPHYLLSGENSIRFEGGSLRSTTHARSGRYSVRLDAVNQFAFLHRFKDVNPGEQFIIRIWKFGGDSNVYIISGAGDGCFTERQSEVTETDENGWQLLELAARMPEDIYCDHYGIFIHNAGGKEVWLDDLEIVRLPAGDEENTAAGEIPGPEEGGRF